MRTAFDGQDCYLAIISKGRPGNVGDMRALLGRDATWYVPADEMEAYMEAGARCYPDRGGLSAGRNQALTDAFAEGLTCLQLDDDLQKMQVAVDGKGHDATADAVLGELLARLGLSDFKLGGVAPTNNAYFSRSKATSTNLFIVGSCCAVAPHRPPLWFDTDLPLKEDYAYTAEHILQFGGVLRCDNLLLTFRHYRNQGGAVDRRTEELEEQVIRKLLARYPGLIKRHPRRPHEVMLRAPRAQRASL